MANKKYNHTEEAKKRIGLASKGNKYALKGDNYCSDLYQTPLYLAWSGMKSRCTNKKASSYQDYGGRGITFCKTWDTFSGFLKDMEGTHKTGLSLDRIDNNGDYCKENCRWATKKEQATNRRSTRLVSYGGVAKTLADWSLIVGVKRSTLAQRYYVYGWSVDRVLSL